MVESLGIIIDCLGIRPVLSKIEAVTQLFQPSAVVEVQILLGMVGYLRKSVLNYSSVLALISDLLRDSRFGSKMAKRLESQDLSAKYHRRWALRLMQYDMEFQW